MVDRGKIQPGKLKMRNVARPQKPMNDELGVEALQRFVEYCEDEAAGLNLSFVAYCLSIAKDALAEELPGGGADLSKRN